MRGGNHPQFPLLLLIHPFYPYLLEVQVKSRSEMWSMPWIFFKDYRCLYSACRCFGFYFPPCQGQIWGWGSNTNSSTWCTEFSPPRLKKIKQDLCHSTSHGQADKQVNHLRRFPSLILWKLIFPQGDTKSHSASKHPCSQQHWLSKFYKVQNIFFLFSDNVISSQTYSFSFAIQKLNYFSSERYIIIKYYNLFIYMVSNLIRKTVYSKNIQYCIQPVTFI